MRRGKKGASTGPEAKPLSAHEAGKLASRTQEAPATYNAKPRSPTLPLTSRQLQILTLMANAVSNPDISRKIDRELATVEKHIENLFKNLGVNTRADAVVWFLQKKNAACERERVRLARKNRRLLAEKARLLAENARLRAEIERLKQEAVGSRT